MSDQVPLQVQKRPFKEAEYEDVKHLLLDPLCTDECCLIESEDNLDWEQLLCVHDNVVYVHPEKKADQKVWEGYLYLVVGFSKHKQSKKVRCHLKPYNEEAKLHGMAEADIEHCITHPKFHAEYKAKQLARLPPLPPKKPSSAPKPVATSKPVAVSAPDNQTNIMDVAFLESDAEHHFDPKTSAALEKLGTQHASQANKPNKRIRVSQEEKNRIMGELFGEDVDSEHDVPSEATPKECVKPAANAVTLAEEQPQGICAISPQDHQKIVQDLIFSYDRENGCFEETNQSPCSTNSDDQERSVQW